MGLDTEQFGIVRLNLLAMKPLASLNKVYAAILREESKQTMSKGMENCTTVEALAFMAVGMDRSKPPN